MTISYNVPITFGRNGTARGLACTGIDFSEDGTQSWTSEPVAEMDVQLPPARQNVLMQVEASPFLIPELLTAQQLFIYLGGMFIGFHPFKAYEIKTFLVSRSILSGRPNRLSLVMPNATSPNASLLNADVRELGLYLDSIVFKSAP